MRTIDIHAHLVPQSLWRAAEAGVPWHGYRHEPGDGLGTVVGGGRRIQFNSPKVRFTPEERLADMDAQGVDVQVISIHTPLFGYHLDAAEGRALAREVNDEIAGMTRQWPRRFAGLATLPVQDVTDGDRRARARGDRPRSQGRRARHGRERRELGRAEVPAAVQGGGVDGRRAVLPPAAAAQLHGGAHAAPRRCPTAWASSSRTRSSSRR